MSSHYLRLIPTEPNYAPPEAAQLEAQLLLAQFVPDKAVTIKTTATVQFIDTGENWGGIRCPACGSELSVEWWQEAMDTAYNRETRGFDVLDLIMPCCGSLRSLNYVFAAPSGFARFVLEIFNVEYPEITFAQLEELEAILGCNLREVWAHY